MFQVGDQVIYGIHGVCRITALESRRVDKRNIEYLVLDPLDQHGAQFYVPSQNQAALSKLRPVMTKEELNELLTIDACSGTWIADENQRKLRYKELITSGDRKALLQLVYCLHKHKKEQELAGKKIHLCDQNFLKDAEKLLNSEFALILNISENDAADFIRNTLEAKK